MSMRRAPFWLNVARHLHAPCAVLDQFCTPFPCAMRCFGSVLHAISIRRASFWLTFACHLHALCAVLAQFCTPSPKKMLLQTKRTTCGTNGWMPAFTARSLEDRLIASTSERPAGRMSARHVIHYTGDNRGDKRVFPLVGQLAPTG
ncbi:hypothetical protein HanIR_Chr16g0802861 [Helianthus annuus]|nr:hypothetical protein HanIR_Chr16g0802861 [Helianthus annuus]